MHYFLVPLAMYMALVSPYPCQHLLLSFFILAIPVDMKLYLTVILICISLMVNLFMCLIVICLCFMFCVLCFLEQCLQFLCSVLNWIILLRVISVLYIFWIYLLPGIGFANTFFHSFFGWFFSFSL